MLYEIFIIKKYIILAGELPDDIGELTSQPDVRLTRTGAKTAPDRPWILDKMNSETSPVTPMKNQKGRKRGNEENDLMKLLAETGMYNQVFI